VERLVTILDEGEAILAIVDEGVIDRREANGLAVAQHLGADRGPIGCRRRLDDEAAFDAPAQGRAGQDAEEPARSLHGWHPRGRRRRTDSQSVRVSSPDGLKKPSCRTRGEDKEILPIATALSEVKARSPGRARNPLQACRRRVP